MTANRRSMELRFGSHRRPPFDGPKHPNVLEEISMEDTRPPRHFNRREFVQLGVAAGLFVSMEQFAGATGTNDIPYRELGSTGEKVSILGVGGYHLGNAKDDAEAVKIVRKALDSGINFLDNSW